MLKLTFIETSCVRFEWWASYLRGTGVKIVQTRWWLCTLAGLYCKPTPLLILIATKCQFVVSFDQAGFTWERNRRARYTRLQVFWSAFQSKVTPEWKKIWAFPKELSLQWASCYPDGSLSDLILSKVPAKWRRGLGKARYKTLKHAAKLSEKLNSATLRCCSWF